MASLSPHSGSESPAVKSPDRRTLVTGAAGFIGSHLVENLSGEGVSALVKPGETACRFPQSVTVFEGDLRDPASLETAMRGVEVVYHLAAISRHDANVLDEDYIAVNVEGTRNVLDAALKAGVRRVVFTATIEAVGMSPDGRPLTEETPQQPRNIYGRTKLQAEEMVVDYFRRHGLETVVVRPPMTYGPRELILLQRLFGVIAKGFFPLIGDGRAVTEFCYVKNQVHGIRLAAEKGRPGETYFISDARSYSIEEIVDAIAAALGVRLVKPRIPVPVALGMGFGFEVLSKVLPFHPFRLRQTGRPPFSRRTVAWTSESRLFCDISKARRELDYIPPYTLEEGIRETVEWYRSNGYLR